MFSTSLHDISRFNRNNSTVRMSHKEWVDTIHIGYGSVGQDLGISLGLPLSIEVPISIVSPGGKVVFSSHSVGMVERSHSSVEMMDQLWVSLGFPLTVMSKPES